MPARRYGVNLNLFGIRFLIFLAVLQEAESERAKPTKQEISKTAATLSLHSWWFRHQLLREQIMKSFNNTERRVFQLFVTILAFICLVPGGAATFGGINGSAILASGQPIIDGGNILRGFADNQYRFGFGVFFTQGLVLLFFLKNMEKHATLFLFVALSLFVGGIGRATNILEFGVIDSAVIGPTLVELVIVPLLVAWFVRIVNHSSN